MDESEQIEEQQAFEWAEAERDYQINETKNKENNMNVLKLEEEIKEKYPNLTQEERLLYMDGYMDGLIEGMTQARDQAMQILNDDDPHPRASEL